MTPPGKRRSAGDFTFGNPTGVHRTDDGTSAPPAPVPPASFVPPAAPEPAPAAPAAPAATPPGAFAAPIAEVAANPLNTRDPNGRPDKLLRLRASIGQHGQMEPCAAVTRAAFLALFPEHEDSIGPAARWVQVAGGRRRAALQAEGEPTIDIIVKDTLASTRAGFISATAGENLERDDFDPYEEALVVKQLLTELGSGNAVAEELNRVAGWVTQRKNLLALTPEVQAAIRVEDEKRRLPLREVRNWHNLDPAEQTKALDQWRTRRGFTDTPADAPAPAPRPAPVSRIKAAIQRLGDTPTTIAATLRAELPPDQRKALAQELLRD